MPEGFIRIEINKADLMRVETLLSTVKDGAPKVMMRALNKTLTGVRTDASKELRNRVTLKKKDLDTHIQVNKASVADLRASVYFDAKGIPLINFQWTADPYGIFSREWKGSGKTFHSHAFIALVGTKKKHEGIFRRINVGAGTWQAAILSKYTKKWAKLPKQYRFPIKQLWGPSVAALMAKTKRPLLPVVQKLAEDRLHNNMAHELDYMLSRL